MSKENNAQSFSSKDGKCLCAFSLYLTLLREIKLRTFGSTCSWLYHCSNGSNESRYFAQFLFVLFLVTGNLPCSLSQH